jgi:tocopherol O-methyltransferase
MPEKDRFVNELFRVTKPGGRMIIVTWCHRELKPGEQKLAPWEERLLHKISKGEHVSLLFCSANYVNHFPFHLALHSIFSARMGSTF